ncbi:Uncharacterised protein [Campylobacter hyointestinalis subsp. hyointestinalis]|nr:Uncharacterised protein [Campylobacter hyointestinalis subsp. hyointestinalis]
MASKLENLEVSCISLVKSGANKKSIIYKSGGTPNLEKEIKIVKSSEGLCLLVEIYLYYSLLSPLERANLILFLCSLHDKRWHNTNLKAYQNHKTDLYIHHSCYHQVAVCYQNYFYIRISILTPIFDFADEQSPSLRPKFF